MGFYSLNRYSNVKRIKGVVIYRFNGALFFANINTFVDDIEKNLDDNTKMGNCRRRRCGFY